jgi:hypothetical protein
MDIKAKITEIVEKVTKDETLKDEFQENPTKAIEKVAGVDLPDDVVNGAIAGIKAKLTGDAISGGIDKIKNLF